MENIEQAVIDQAVLEDAKLNEGIDQSTPDKEKNDIRYERMEQRMDIIQSLMIRGINRASEIQRYMTRIGKDAEGNTIFPHLINVSLQTIGRDKEEVLRRNMHAAKTQLGLNVTLEEHLVNLGNTYREVLKELWVIHSSPRTPATAKVSALKEIRETTTDQIRFLQDAGLVKRAPIQHQMVDAEGNPVQQEDAPPKEALLDSWIAFTNAQWRDPITDGKEVATT